MAESKFDDCFCALGELLGGAKDQVVLLIDALIVQLEVLKATLLLFNTDIENLIKKEIYELEIAVIETALATVESPFNLILMHTRTLADCPPVNTFAKVLRDVKNVATGDLRDKVYELDQYILALEDKDREIEKLDRLILMLNETKIALDLCGTT